MFYRTVIIILGIPVSTYCQAMVTSGHQGITSLIPMIFLLLMIIATIIWFKRRKKQEEILIPKEKVTTFPRILFGILLVFLGIAGSSDAFSKFFQSKNPDILSQLFASLVLATGGVRLFIKSKPSIDKDGTVYADFGKRFWANTIDGILFLTAFYTLHLLLDKVSYISFILVTTLIAIIAHVFVIWLISIYHATPGKMLMGLVVKTVDKNDVTVKNALLRSSIDIMFSLIYAIAFLNSLKSFSYSEFTSLPFFKGMAYSASHFPVWDLYNSALSQFWFWSELVVLMFNNKRRAIHDYIANTVVIERNRP